MTIKIEEFDELWFRDIKGVRREISGLPLKSRKLFKRYYALARDRMKNGNLPVDQLYDQDRWFAEAVDKCLNLHGIEPGDINMVQLIRLLFARTEPGIEAPDGTPLPLSGLLVEMEFPSSAASPDPEGEGEYIDTDLDPEDYVVAMLWSQQGGRLDDVLQSANSVPFSELQSILACRADQIKKADPKHQAERKAEKKAEAEIKVVERMRDKVFAEAAIAREEGREIEDYHAILDEGWEKIADPF